MLGCSARSVGRLRRTGSPSFTRSHSDLRSTDLHNYENSEKYTVRLLLQKYGFLTINDCKGIKVSHAVVRCGAGPSAAEMSFRRSLKWPRPSRSFSLNEQQLLAVTLLSVQPCLSPSLGHCTHSLIISPVSPSPPFFFLKKTS